MLHLRRNVVNTLIAKLTTEALFEQEKAGAIYPPHIVEVALTAWVWKKTSSKEELLPYFEAMPQLLADNVKLGAGNKIIGFTDANGNTVSVEDWQKQEFTKKQYVDFKEDYKKNGATDELVKKLTDNPELSAFIGNGYYVYDVKLPPKRTYGSAKHPSLAGQKPDTFPDCGSSSLRSFFEMVLFNPQTRTFDLTILKDLAKKYNEDKAEKDKIDISFLGEDELEPEEEFVLPEFSKDWPGLKQLVWFFMKYPKPTRIQDATNDWALVTSDFDDVIYIKGKPQAAPVCEIEAGIANLMKVAAKLIPDPGLVSTKADVNEANEEILTKLCEIFSTKDKKLTWESPDGDQTLKADTWVMLTFTVNNKKTFTWKFNLGHFELTPIVKKESHFQLDLQDSLVDLYYKNLSVYLFNFYVDPANFTELTKKHQELTWPLIYTDLYNEAGKKRAITYMFENKKREHYQLAWHLMSQMPTNDWRNIEFMFEVFQTDKDWFFSLPKNNVIKVRFAELLKNYNNAKEVGYLLISKGCLSFIKWAEDHQIITLDAKIIDSNDWLYTAVRRRDTEIVELLLDRGANTEAENEVVFTALTRAVSMGHIELVKLLLDRGASIDAKDGNFDTALTKAVSMGHIELVKLLLDRGANIEAKGGYSATALTNAVSGGHTEIVKLLLDRGANIDAKDRDDGTALSESAAGGHTEIVKLLVESGADIHAIDTDGKTAYDWAKKTEIKDYLKNIMDNFKYPPKKGKQGGKSFEYLKYLVELRKKKNLPPRLLTYWANQTLSGLQYGVRNTFPNKEELDEILEALALSASGVEYEPDDRWVTWSIFRNKKGNQRHMKNIYTFIRYAQMRLAGMKDNEIIEHLKKDDKALNATKVGTHGDVKQQFDQIIDQFKAQLVN